MKKPAALKAISRDPNREIEQALSGLEKAIGGRTHIHHILAQGELTEPEQLLVDLLADPRNDSRSLAKVCGQAHFSLGRLLELFKKAKGAQALVLAVSRVYDRLPEIAGDIADRSVPQLARCAPCKGLGIIKSVELDENGSEKRDPETKLKVWIEEQCWPCEGTGQVTILPDLERQKIALQIGGLLKDKPSIQIDARQQSAFVRTNSGFREATDRLLFGQPAVPQVQGETIDAEVEDVKAES